MVLLKFHSLVRGVHKQLNLTGMYVRSRFFNNQKEPLEDFILKNTVVSENHLTPELKLQLITPECELWYSKGTESVLPNDPFWAIYWPGGQALGRFILDNSVLFENKTVLDIGSGSGACALAAAKSGAKCVLANDIDPVSLTAIEINSKLNNLKVHTCVHDLLEKDVDSLIITSQNERLHLKWDIILIGDMFYDTDFSFKLFAWLLKLVEKNKLVLVGDPGRHALKDLESMKNFGHLEKIAEYKLLNKEFNGFLNSSVFKPGFLRTSVSSSFPSLLRPISFSLNSLQGYNNLGSILKAQTWVHKIL